MAREYISGTSDPMELFRDTSIQHSLVLLEGVEERDGNVYKVGFWT